MQCSQSLLLQMQNIKCICVFDYGSKELGLNHLISLQRADIDNYMAFVTDERTFKYIKQRGDFNVTFEKFAFSGPLITINKKNFGTQEFNMFSYYRYKIINDLLKKGTTVWYMDVDTVVTPYINNVDLNEYRGRDVVFQNDCHMMCTGCVLYYPTRATVDFTGYIWRNASAEKNDQNLIFDMYNQQKLQGLNYTVLNYLQFPNGLLYFDDEDKIEVPPQIIDMKLQFRKNQMLSSGETGSVAFVHANWMIGNETKEAALKKKGLWFIQDSA